MSDVFNQLYYKDIVLDPAGANSQGNTVIIPKTDLDLTAILAAGKCRSDYADVSLAYKDNGGYTELDRQIWSPQYNWGGIKFDLVDDIVNISDYRVYYGECDLTVPNKADPDNVGYWSDDCNEDQSYVLDEAVGAGSSFIYSAANKNFTCTWIKDNKYSRRRMLLPDALTLDFSTDWHLEFLFNITTKQNLSFGFTGLYNTAKTTNKQDCLGVSINTEAGGAHRGVLRYYNSTGAHTFLSKACAWVLGQDYRVRVEHDAASTTLTAQVWDCVADVQLTVFSISTLGKNIVLNCIGPGVLNVIGGQTVTGTSDNICVQSWRERIDGLVVVLSVGAEQNNPAYSSDGVVFSDSDDRSYTGRGSSFDGFKLGDTNNSGFYFFGNCLDGIKLSDVVAWFKPPGPAPWYGWEEEVGVELELEKILLVYINFEEYARAGIVDSKSFQSYLKMDKDLISSLMKKIEGGKSNIKMN